MIKIRKSYYNAIKKYGTAGVLKMYLDNKIELNAKEWKNLHNRINKSVPQEKKIKMWNYGICIIAILIFALIYKGNYAEQISKCREIMGHECTRYEIDKNFEK